ncbi:MAG: hypothetical protein LH645_03045 [Actinomycetia bacterium]|nr:hypothetical protein [Actinomycetes bacterium]
MTSLHRWLIVALATALAIGTPLALRELPASNTTATATERLAQLHASAAQPYSGYVESLGTLQLPVADELLDLGPLFGERTRMRVWWNDPVLWRVDRLTATGEEDLVQSGGVTTQWAYEGTKVTKTPEADVRLPRISDLLPPELARYLLEDVQPADAATLPAERIAGRSALGLSVAPPDPRSSVDHVDVWIDEETGVPLRLSLFADGSSNSALSSTFLDFSPGASSSDVFDFSAPRESTIERSDVVDVADAANRFAPVRPPRTAAGLPLSRDTELRGVGVYGTGLTRVLAIPLWKDVASPLREQLLATPTVEQLAEGPALSVGPLGILLTHFTESNGGWLIAGTVTQETLADVAVDLQKAQPLPSLFREG